jgi:hypothetical protein
MDVADVIVLTTALAGREGNFAICGWIPPFFGALVAYGLGVSEFEAFNDLALAARLALVVVCTVGELACVRIRIEGAYSLPFIVAPGAGAVVPNVVKKVDTLAGPAHRVALLAMVLGNVTEETLFVFWLQRMLRNPQVVISVVQVLLVKFAFLLKSR